MSLFFPKSIKLTFKYYSHPEQEIRLAGTYHI